MILSWYNILYYYFYKKKQIKTTAYTWHKTLSCLLNEITLKFSKTSDFLKVYQICLRKKLEIENQSPYFGNENIIV